MSGMIGKNWICSVIAICALLFPLHQAAAHSGGTDRHGCHRNTQTGDYHCHNKKEKDDINWAVVGGVAGGVLALWLLVKWLDDEDSSSPVRLQIVPQFDEKSGPAIAAEYSLDDFQRIGVRSMTPATNGRGSAYVGAYWRLRF